MRGARRIKVADEQVNEATADARSVRGELWVFRCAGALPGSRGVLGLGASTESEAPYRSWLRESHRGSNPGDVARKSDCVARCQWELGGPPGIPCENARGRPTCIQSHGG